MSEMPNNLLSKDSDIVKRTALPRVCTVMFALFMFLTLVLSLSCRPSSKGRFCGTNLAGLQKGLIVYAYDHDSRYPPADKWCDLLIQDDIATPKVFVCPQSDAKIGESSYAMNENVGGRKPSELPPDIVVLFETKRGWNQSGGPEILTTENHRGKGCNVVFNDGNVNFVRAEHLGQLKWKTEDVKQ